MRKFFVILFFAFCFFPRFFANAENSPSTAVLVSDYTIQKTPNPIFYRWEIQGTFKTLERLHVSYAILHDDDIQLPRLKNFKLLILPDTKNMSRRQTKEIETFVQNGGKLFATGLTSYRDEEDHPANPENNFQLSDLFGADFASYNATPPQAGALKFENHSIALGRNRAAFITLHPTAKVLAEWLNDDRETLSEPQNLDAAIIENLSNQVIYSGENLFAVENSNGIAVQKIISALLNLLVPGIATEPERSSLTFPSLPTFGLLPAIAGSKSTNVSVTLPYPPVSGFITSEGYFRVFAKFGGFLTEPPNSMIAFQATPEGFLVAGRSGTEFTFKPETPNHPLEIALWRESNIPAAPFMFAAYRGQLILSGVEHKKIINRLPLEAYVAGVITHEVPFHFHSEALKAMSIVARTFVLEALSKHQAQDANLCATIHCQAYEGLAYEAKTGQTAVEETRSQVLTFQNHLADVPYHSTCGGITEDAQNVWSHASPPYLHAVVDGEKPIAQDLSAEEGVSQFLKSPSDSFCEASSRFRWQKHYSSAELRMMFLKNLPIILKRPVSFNRILSVDVKQRTPHGRVTHLEIQTDQGNFLLASSECRWVFGNGEPGLGGLPSTLFVIQQEKDAQGQLTGVTLLGGGWGHGVGLCQSGAEGMAERHYSYAQILQHYYPGTTLKIGTGN